MAFFGLCHALSSGCDELFKAGGVSVDPKQRPRLIILHLFR